MLHIILTGIVFLAHAAAAPQILPAAIGTESAPLAILIVSSFGTMWTATGITLRDAIRRHIDLRSIEQFNRNRQ